MKGFEVIILYPNFFAASATEPSTAQIKSSKACIPCRLRKWLITTAQIFIELISSKKLKGFKLWYEYAEDKKDKADQNKLRIFRANLWATIRSSDGRLCWKNLKKLLWRCIRVKIYSVSD